ncbi:transglutaminase-like cysteine peptidase [Escherichia coli]|nr:transglutaminase-like cysteine peptidase [Escherichia coli]
MFGMAGAAQAGASMTTGGATSQPIGHYEFCKEYPRLCSIRSRDAGPIKLDDAMWQTVSAINVAVNKAIRPMNDIDIYGKTEVWAFPTAGVGDCEDYVLEKQRLLVKAGIPTSDLLITVLRKPDGEGHAVLTVRTDIGDYILDNLNNDIVHWSDTGYHFLKRQSSTDTGRWVSIRGGETTPSVASVD